MFAAENLRDWIGLAVVDPDESKVGSLESLYFDTASEQATFAAVRIGNISGHKLVFVPLAGALVSPKHLKVTYPKKLIKAAPSIGEDGELQASEEPALFAHYGLSYVTGSSGERRLGRR
jgi:hypothetical protein